MKNSLKFNLTKDHSERKLIRDLTKRYTIKKQAVTTGQQTYFDTFDWRLFNRSLVLCAIGDRLNLRRLNKSDLVESIPVESSVPLFIKDFPKGRLKDRLAPLIKMRMLLELVRLSSISTAYCVLNQDQKTVARLFFEKIHSSSGRDSEPIASYLWLKPIRGYPKYLRSLTKRLGKYGLTSEKEKDIYFCAMEAANRIPNDYTAKISVPLDPGMRADEATKAILRFLLQIIKINEAYIERDLDTEFLHDFRVAIRRTRSALNQIKNVFPKESVDRFKKDFAFIGKLSNDLRDQDVYLLNETIYRKLLPDVLQDDIDPLFDYLKRERKKSLRKVVSGIKSAEYKRILRDWEKFLTREPDTAAMEPNAGLPIIDLSSSIIHKQYRRVLKSGKRIHEDTEDAELHRLRITCKKLRYMIEFYAVLYPPGQIKNLINQLKKLQDNLGDFNDLCVQMEYLLAMAEKLPLTGRQSKNTLVALGSLIDKLDTKKQSVRQAFAETFRKFSSPKNKNLFDGLFG